MLKKAFEKAAMSVKYPNPIPETFRKKWYDQVRATKEALKELHTNNEVDYIGLN